MVSDGIEALDDKCRMSLLGGAEVSLDAQMDAQGTALEPRTSVFFHDCTFVDYPGQVHGAFAQLERLPEAVRRKMVLMHHEDDLELHRERAEALGFRVALPGDAFDLVRGVRL